MLVRISVLLLSLANATVALAAQSEAPTAVAQPVPAQQAAAGAPAAATPANGTPAAATTPAKVDPRIEISSRIPGTRPDELRATPIPNIYELTRGSEIAYVTTDGKYAISGDMFDIPKNDDLTEDHRRDLRVQQIGSIPESQMVIFGPKEPKYTVTVFTDVDCAYCRQLHSQIADYNRLGIRVRYLFYPRSGPNTESWTKAEAVWCSDNRNDALTRAKLGQPVKAKHCGDTPVARTYAMGRDFGLQGTPAIVAANGTMFPGYLPPNDLLQELKKAQRQ
jgi:thiol:disulfide interchange protein DsbC